MVCKRPFFRLVVVPFIAGVVHIATGCGNGPPGSSPTEPPLSVTTGVSSVLVPQDGESVNVGITITGASGTPAVLITGLPSGMTQQFAAAGSGPSGNVTLTGSATVPAGTYIGSVTVNLVGATAAVQLTVISAPVAHVGSNVDTTLGVAGHLQQFMATSFQIFQYTGDIFGSGSTAIAREQELTNLGAQHLRMQVIAGGMPMVSNTGTAADWDFSTLDTTVQPVLASADHSPEFQIGTAPAWMCNSGGQLDVAAHSADFAAYAANLVRYYNKGGFTWGGTHFQSPSSSPITWWGIFNEYNLNGLSALDYVTLYNTVVAAMLEVDPTLKFSALEFADFGLGSGGSGDPQQFLPAFLASSAAGGVNTQVDVLSTHFYATCNQSDTDTTLFAQVPVFAQNVQYFYQELANRPDLASTQVWVTENNVNADYEGANGRSTCNPNQVFVDDRRGTSSFFAAWRPYVFSQLGKAGNRALYQWEYSADQQYGEVDPNSNPYLSYWVDRTLATLFPSTPSSPGEDILSLTTTDNSSIEALATRNANGTVVVMIVDRAVHSPTDNNGAGDPRTVIVDTTPFGTFSVASLLILDGGTNIANGPTGAGITPANRIPVTIPGYGVAFLTLTP